nr:FAD-dependent thymidylate synthase [Spirochaetota bacterium]
SATAFAQLKRHRLASLIDGDYSPKLGVTIPPSIKEVGLENFFNEKIALVDEFYKKLDKNYLYSRDYILTNAHRKNVYFKCNFRELVHVCRLRMDKHSQWDIRNIAFLMSKAVKNKYKFVGDFLTGKDAFSSLD